MWIPKPHQLEHAKLGLQILKANAIVYLGSEERTGKTVPAILIAEGTNIERILVLTKKKALDGWHEALNNLPHKKVFRVTNYHKACNIEGDYDLIILDEAHNYISGSPKRMKIWNDVYPLTKGKPLVYISATPHAQGYQMLFNQFALSSWSPWKRFNNYYDWHRVYGIENKIKLHGRWIEQWNKVDSELVKADIDHLFITKTRAELGFEHEPEDILHYIELSKTTMQQYNYMLKEKVIKLGGYDLLLDTVMKLRTSLHMLEGGVAKNTVFERLKLSDTLVKVARERIDDVSIYHTYYSLKNNEKIQYIMTHWGDNKNVAIMYNYIAEGIRLNKIFKNAAILQASSNAEGVDLSMFEHLIIYSQNFSTAQHTQRRARQANMERKTPIKVHFLLVKKAVSEQVYKTVSINKVNYVDSRFERDTLS